MFHWNSFNMKVSTIISTQMNAEKYESFSLFVWNIENILWELYWKPVLRESFHTGAHDQVFTNKISTQNKLLKEPRTCYIFH